MKLIYLTKKSGFIIFLIITIGFTSCTDYLDVVPPEQADLEDATKDYAATEKFLYSCYAGVGQPFNVLGLQGASDEYVLPPLYNAGSQQHAKGLATPQNTVGWPWGNYYRYIGQCHLFLQELPKARGVSDQDKKEWAAHANFLIAYYHMQVLLLYGPCPINDEYIDMDAEISSYPGRSHFDYVTDWIVDKLDAAADDLPAIPKTERWGLATSVIAKSLKGRLLTYAASPLWNGSFPYPNWQNTNFETPGYGTALVSNKYDEQKWVRAKAANQEALDFAIGQGGISLFKDEELYLRENINLPFVPGVNAQDPEGEAFLKKVLLMRYLVTTRSNEGNNEIIWGSANQGDVVDHSLPHYILTQNNGTPFSRWSAVSPVLNTTIEYFYTKNGKRPANDPEFTDRTNWFRSAGVTDRSDIIGLNVDREPRFYAWMSFDGGDYGSKLADGSPVRMELRNGDKQGYNPAKYNRDNNVTGYLSQKFIMPKLTVTKTGSWNLESKPRPLIRLAELYLNLAESQAALGETGQAIDNLNIIRERAGVPDLTSADVGSKSITEWVHNERFIELWGEGHRYYDVRRWMIAPKTMGQGMRTGLDAYGKVNPSFEEFNTPTPVNQNFVWTNRMYLLPLFYIEVYKNPQMIQSPGYN